jgi:hypothetical protein
MEVIEQAYAECGASQDFSFFIENGRGHVLSDAMWERTRSKFLEHLPPT